MLKKDKKGSYFNSITWLITNRCKLGCKYCNFSNRPIKEADIERKLGALEVLRGWKNADKRFIVLLGGDLLWMEDVELFIAACKKFELPYAFQSSCADAGRMEKLIKQVGFENLSISVDPMVVGDMSRFKKALCGIYWAGRVKEKYKNVDIHCTITVDKENYLYVPETAKMLSDMGIWVEITMVHWKKPGFDLVPPREFVKGFSREDVALLKEFGEGLIKMKEKGVKIHSSAAFLSQLHKYPELDWKCSAPRNLVLDADLSVRACLHMPGKRVSKWNIFQLRDESSWKNFMVDWKQDTQDCPGCLWDCQVELERLKDDSGIVSQEKVDDWFNHRSK